MRDHLYPFVEKILLNFRFLYPYLGFNLQHFFSTAKDTLSVSMVSCIIPVSVYAIYNFPFLAWLISSHEQIFTLIVWLYNKKNLDGKEKCGR